jgi:uncharacterized membrane protein YidH (DUF202 family)
MERKNNSLIYQLEWKSHLLNDIVIKRTNYADSWSGEESNISQLQCAGADVPKILSGDFGQLDMLYHLETTTTTNGDAVAASSSFFKNIKEEVIGLALFPMLRTTYVRTQFRHLATTTTTTTMEEDVTVCFANLDEEIRMMVEPLEAGEFRRPDDRPLDPKSIERFPYGVFELTISDASDGWPKWVEELIDDGSLNEIYNFSKCLTGMALLYDDCLDVKPMWMEMLLPETQTITTATTKNINVDVHNTTSSSSIGTSHMNNTSTTTSATGVTTTSYPSSASNSNTAIFPRFPVGLFDGKEQILPIKLEPKVWFANERTYLHWLKLGTSLYLSGAAVTHYLDKLERLSGYIVMSLGVGLVFYSIVIYYRRAQCLHHRTVGPYDDPVGPLVLVVALIAIATVELIAQLNGTVKLKSYN